jgi:hypothetical protein
MADKAKYRPAAPSDGFGHIQLSESELDDKDRLRAERFAAEEDSRQFNIGCAGGTDLMALAYIIEAARCLCGAERTVAKRLLKLALAEMAIPNGDGYDREPT